MKKYTKEQIEALADEATLKIHEQLPEEHFEISDGWGWGVRSCMESPENDWDKKHKIKISVKIYDDGYGINKMYHGRVYIENHFNTITFTNIAPGKDYKKIVDETLRLLENSKDRMDYDQRVKGLKALAVQECEKIGIEVGGYRNGVSAHCSIWQGVEKPMVEYQEEFRVEKGCSTESFEILLGLLEKSGGTINFNMKIDIEDLPELKDFLDSQAQK